MDYKYLSNIFDQYSFLTYVTPGMLGSLLLYWFIEGFFGYSLGLDWHIILLGWNFVGYGVLLILISYPLGHLIQILGSWIEQKTFKENDWPSVKLLCGNNNYKVLTKVMPEIFKGLINSSNFECEGSQKNSNIYNKFFYLCYNLMIQKGNVKRILTFNQIYIFLRGLLATILIGILISAAIAIKHLLLGWYYFYSNQKISLLFLNFSTVHLTLGILVLAFFVGIYKPVKNTFKKFAFHFVDSVYMNFYLWYQDYLKDKQFSSN